MNDDPNAASAPARSSAPSDDDDRDDIEAASQDEDEAAEGSSRPRDSRRARRSRNGRRRSSSKIRRAKAGISKKISFMTDLMSSLDAAIFVELCVLYYMDCSFFRLALRAFVQNTYLNPSWLNGILAPPQPKFTWVFGSNAVCMVAHLVFAPLEAGEAMRGYLHGGVITDFIGQKAPASRFSLLLLDCLILGLQCVSCAVWLERNQVKQLESTLKSVSAGGTPKSSSTAAAAAVDVLTGAMTSTQDLDSEERGVIRDDPLGVDDTNDIEMQPLMRARPRAEDGDIQEARFQRIVRTNGGSTGVDGPSRPSLLDVLVSGHGLLANLHVPDAIWTMMTASEGLTSTADTPSTASYALRLTGYGARIAQLAAESQFARARQQRE